MISGKQETNDKVTNELTIYIFVYRMSKLICIDDMKFGGCFSVSAPIQVPCSKRSSYSFTILSDYIEDTTFESQLAAHNG